MAVPKRRTSRANTHSRRSQWKAESAALVPVSISGVQYNIPRKFVKAVKGGYLSVDDIS